MNELPPNSNKYKTAQQPEEKPRMSMVVSKPAKLKEDTAFRKIISKFIQTDAKTLKDYIVNDVVIPLIKRGISETVNMTLYNTPISRSNNGNRYQYGGYVNSTGPNVQASKQQPRKIGGFNFDKIVFVTRGDAELALNEMNRAIEQYGAVRVLDIYDVAGITTDQHTADKYGWTDLSTANIVRDPDGYRIIFPDVKPV